LIIYFLKQICPIHFSAKTFILIGKPNNKLYIRLTGSQIQSRFWRFAFKYFVRFLIGIILFGNFVKKLKRFISDGNLIDYYTGLVNLDG